MEEEKLNHSSGGVSQVFDVREDQVTQQEAVTEDFQMPTSNNPDQSPAATKIDTDEGEWVTGIKLGVIISAISTAAFLMLLDVSIVATVSVSTCVHHIVLTR
jgi:hypothetical protein